MLKLNNRKKASRIGVLNGERGNAKREILISKFAPVGLSTGTNTTDSGNQFHTLSVKTHLVLSSFAETRR